MRASFPLVGRPTSAARRLSGGNYASARFQSLKMARMRKLERVLWFAAVVLLLFVAGLRAAWLMIGA